MKNMNMPGFTADTSLYNSSRKYNMPSAANERSSSVIRPQLRAGGGGLSNKCDDRWGDCYIGCSVDYPESKDSPNNLNSDLRAGCFDSCDASHRRCSPARGALHSNQAPIFGRGVRTLAL
jgi:hypothetical protein